MENIYGPINLISPASINMGLNNYDDMSGFFEVALKINLFG